MLFRVLVGVCLYLKEVWEYRYFWICLTRAELHRRYRRSMIGMGWSLLQPLCMTAVLTMVYSRVFKRDIWEFSPLILCGLAFWNMFTQIVLQGCGSLVIAEPYIRQQPLPVAIFPLRTVLAIGFHFLISLTMALVFVSIVKGGANVYAMLTLVPTLVLLFLWAWSLATIVSFSHVYFPDTSHICELLLQALLFLTPIMYPPELLVQNGLEFMLHYNPLAVLLELLRGPILYSQVPPVSAYATAAAMVSLPCVIATWLVSRLEDKVIFAL